MNQLPLAIRCTDAWRWTIYTQCKWLRDTVDCKDEYRNLILDFIEIEASELCGEQFQFKRNDYIKALQQKVDNYNNRITKK